VRTIISVALSSVLVLGSAFAEAVADDGSGFICSTFEPSHSYYGVYKDGAAWKFTDGLPGSTPDRIRIGVFFLDGSPQQRQFVMDYAPDWTGPEGATIEWVFDNADMNHIRITFETNENKSAIGTDAKHKLDGPTMWLADVSARSSLERIQRVIRHEFGHAIGLHHEHLHPGINLTWNTDDIVNEMMNIGWCKGTVDECKKEVKSQITGEKRMESLKVCPGARNFDSHSIMLYDIRKEWNQEGKAYRASHEISDNDLACARSLYPRRSISLPTRYPPRRGPCLICEPPYPIEDEIGGRPQPWPPGSSDDDEDD
jgi:hypothetical protein